MVKRKESSSIGRARRYSDCAPHAPCEKGSGRAKRFGTGTIGPVASGFDHYGYPIIRNFRLPEPYHLSTGRHYEATAIIKPMKLATDPPVKPSIPRVDDFRIKPSPTVPGAPRDLPAEFEFCIQKGRAGHFFRFRDSRASLHGSEVNVIGHKTSHDGMILCSVRVPGLNGIIDAPLCEEYGSDKEPLSSGCCVRILGNESGQIVCPGSSYDLLVAKIVTLTTVHGIQIAAIEHPDLPGGGARLPVCEPMDEELDERPCCIDESTGRLVCPEGLSHPLDGKRIPLQYLEFVDGLDGSREARLRCGDLEGDQSLIAGDPTLRAMRNICEEFGGYIFPVCSSSTPRLTPKRVPRLPDICCYDPDSGSLVCEGTHYHGLQVEVVTETVIGGRLIVSVSHESLPGGGMRIPVCAPRPEIPIPPPVECCVIESDSGLTLVCDPENHPWNGKEVADFGRCIDTPNGRICILRWEDRHGAHTIEVPICPSPTIPVPRVPPTPDPGSHLPPPTRPPANKCESEEARRCREKWDAVVKSPAKMSKCDQKWMDILRRLQSGNLGSGPGRRFGTGIRPNHLKHARFPGLRGGRGTIE